jgi:hypothetical protein
MITARRIEMVTTAPTVTAIAAGNASQCAKTTTQQPKKATEA